MGLVDLARRAHIALTTPASPDLEAASPPVNYADTRGAYAQNVAVRVSEVYSRDTAMSLPTIRRARNLHCALAGSLPLTYWRRASTVGGEPTQLEPATWMERPDPNHTLTWLTSWTVDDLIWWERAYWRVTARYARPSDFPAAFERLAPTDVHVGHGGVVTFKGEEIRAEDLIVFEGTGDSVLTSGARTIATALALDAAARRYADVDMPTGYLRQTDGEALDEFELAELADMWEAARRQRTTGALPLGIDFVPVNSDPEALQLVESRQHSALEQAKLMDVPPWTVGASSGPAMVYQNGQQARADLIDFGTRRFLDVIEGTLSGPNVTPRGTFVKFDLAEWLENPFNEGTPSGAPQNRSDGND